MRVAAIFWAVVLASGAAAQKPKPKPPVKPVPTQNQTKVQGQQKGLPGVFGETYTLKSEWNLTLVSAAYSLAPQDGTHELHANAEQKFIVFRYRIKNASKMEREPLSHLDVTLVDAKGNNYEDAIFAVRASTRVGLSGTLKPGQGLDDLIAARQIPNDAKIVKVIVNEGRATVAGEQVIRYFMAGATDTEAGGKPDPRNAIAPIPAPFADPKDPSGATALVEFKGAMKSPVPLGHADASVESIQFARKFGEMEAEDGKRFLIATVKLKNLARSPLNLDPGNGTGPVGIGAYLKIVDGDGETQVVETIWHKPNREEPLGMRMLAPGEEGLFRCHAIVPAGPLKTLTLGVGDASTSHRAIIDISGFK